MEIKKEETVCSSSSSEKRSLDECLLEDLDIHIFCSLCLKFSRISYNSLTKPMNACCDVCFAALYKKSKENWIRKVYNQNKSCHVCCNMFNEVMSIDNHDCTNINYFKCYNCQIIFNRKNDLLKHIKNCVNRSSDFRVSVRSDCGGTNLSFKTSKNYKSNLIKKCNSVDKAKKFKCDVCEKIFKSNLGLKYHLRIHTEEEPYQRQQCKKQFRRPDYLEQHLLLHKEEKSFKCQYCFKSFSTNDRLKIHTRIHTGETPYYCQTCKKSFKDPSNFNRHLRIHNGRNPEYLKCNICKKLMSCRYNLKHHMQIHTGERLYPCLYCEKTFTRSYHLKDHVSIHTGENHCQYCKKSFTRSSGLKKHLQIHNGEKPYPCQYCKKAFTRSHHLKDHVRIHTGEKPYHCQYCKKSFNCVRGLKQHLLIHERKRQMLVS